MNLCTCPHQDASEPRSNHDSTCPVRARVIFYAGIGSRETPVDVLRDMIEIGYRMARKGFGLRSGAAGGADAAFEAGHRLATAEGHPVGPKEIFLPWKGFNAHASQFYPPSGEAHSMAALYHPAWDRCSAGARAMHARNCHQVLGLGLDDPVSRIICWTPKASGSGGTGQAIRIARHHNIRVDDLGDPATLAKYRAALAVPAAQD